MPALRSLAAAIVVIGLACTANAANASYNGYRTFSLFPFLGAFLSARAFQTTTGIEHFYDMARPMVLPGANLYISPATRRGRGERMKIIEIVPRARKHLYGTLVAKEAAIRKSGRGTYVRVGRKSQRAARWKHKKFKGTLDLNRGASEAVTAKVRASTPEDERKLLSSFLGFVDRHAGDQVTTITIHYR